MDHEGYLPSFALISEGKTHDVKVAHTLSFEPGTVVVDDRGYNDYRLFAKWTEEEVYFVTRMKENALYKVVEDRPVPQNRHVLKDQVIGLTGIDAWEKCPYLLRRVEAYSAEKGEVLVFLTNHFGFGATTIAAIYKDRWQIELFFKALKQNLKIKTFVGTSANAVKIQVWTALIAMLILRYLQLKSKFSWSLSNLVALLRMNLFTYRDLWAWLDQPFWDTTSGRSIAPAGGFGLCLIRTAEMRVSFLKDEKPVQIQRKINGPKSKTKLIWTAMIPHLRNVDMDGALVCLFRIERSPYRIWRADFSCSFSLFSGQSISIQFRSRSRSEGDDLG
ncbi:MAG: IS4 family transposase [Candidatus Binatia bacterium]